jgi:hypothetical protein
MGGSPDAVHPRRFTERVMASDSMTGLDAIWLTFDVPERATGAAAVVFVLGAENPGNHPVDLYLRGRTIAFDIIVETAAGEPVWRRLAGEVIQAVLRVETLPPGGRLEFVAEWDTSASAGGAAGAGEYIAWGELLTDGAPLVSPRRSFRIA